MNTGETIQKCNNSGDDVAFFSETLLAVDELYHTRDTYFPANPLHKISKMQQLSTSALHLLDSIPPVDQKTPTQRAMYEYLRGKILDALPHYKKEAEEHLSKAVKLNPSLGDAWLSLGNCIWKKGELMVARNCMRLALSKGPNKRILCQLSMLERKIAQDSGDQAERIETSVKFAKEAVALDVKDGYTWYNLGNALLFSFFMSGQWDHSKLQQSLKAYQNAERDDKMMSNPDLYYNSATANRYLENYERALTGFEAAASKDPGLSAPVEVQKIVQLLDSIDKALTEQSKPKRPTPSTSSLTKVIVDPRYRKATIDILLEGVNKAVAIVGMAVSFIDHVDAAPQFYLLRDSNQTCYVLSAYRLHCDAIKIGDQVTVLDPSYRHVDFSWKGKRYRYESLRVDFREQVRVNGMLPPFELNVGTSIYAQHEP